MTSSSSRSPAVLMLLSSEVVAARHRALREAAPELEVVTSLDDCDPERIDALFAFKLAPGLVPRLPNLKLVASVGAGADGLLAAGDIPPHVWVTRVVEAGLGLSMAQYVAYQVLRRFRGFDRYEDQQSERQWQRHPIPDSRRHTVGVMGVGEIGGAVAQALLALGFRVTGWSRSGHGVEGMHVMYSGDAERDAFLAQTDTLVCLLPFTTATRGLLDARLLRKLKPGAFVVNAARGGILDEAALVALVDEGHLSGAALDVFATEPLPPDDALWRHPHITVTPHIAAQPTVQGAVTQFLHNLQRVRSGLPPLHAIDRKAGY
jgi:phosphoglycerate dehydrogenase-like enzyme